ncbi:MAG: glycosyltransferase family 2 protein [Flavobacteriaceae bacterium]
MNAKPLLSVHILTYNCEHYIEATLESVLKQKTDFKYEIVIGDDNSTDNTNTILAHYAKRYPDLINYKRNEKQLGILKNFKTTLDRCKGAYVFDLAGDDFLNQNHALQKMVGAFKNDDSLGFIDSGYNHYYEKTKKTDYFINKKFIACSKNEYKNALLLGKIIPAGVCYKREALYKHIDFDFYLKKGLTIEDYPMLVDMVMNTNFYRINEVLVTYRVHNKSHSHMIDFEKQLFLKKQMLDLVAFFSKKYNLSPDVINEYKTEYYKSCLYLAGYFEKKEMGKDMFFKLNKPVNFKLAAYYLCSQNSLFRRFYFNFGKL